MVVNILEPTASMARPLDYNGTKVALGVASVLSACNIDGDSQEDIQNTFARYERAVWSSRNISFHMSVNPGPGEDMDDGKAVRFVGKMMEGLGYSRQPYVIYKHNDIDRVHYHVVSIRTDLGGRKIRDYYENRRCLELMKSLVPEFGYVVGKGDGKRADPLDVIRFDPRAGDVVTQLKVIFADCLRYSFTSLEQFRLILRAHGIGMDTRSGFSTKMYLRGLDADGRPCTRQVTERASGMRLYALYSARAMECMNLVGAMKRERERICGCMKGPLEHSRSLLHFRRMLAKNGIDVRLVRDPNTGAVVSGDVVDHHTRCAFRLSDLEPALSARKIAEADRDQWEDGRESGNDEGESGDISPEALLGDLLAGLGGGGTQSRTERRKKGIRRN